MGGAGECNAILALPWSVWAAYCTPRVFALPESNTVVTWSGKHLFGLRISSSIRGHANPTPLEDSFRSPFTYSPRNRLAGLWSIGRGPDLDRLDFCIVFGPKGVRGGWSYPGGIGGMWITCRSPFLNLGESTLSAAGHVQSYNAFPSAHLLGTRF